ncbi:MAG: sulfotransferase [Pirellulales bacterium]|nr:sulfotransferase [Pirellulales bacterium]
MIEANRKQYRTDPGYAQAEVREWAPRFWLGCDYLGLWKLFARNRFRIGLRQWPAALADLYITSVHPVLRGLQNLALARKVQATEITPPPLFILGHWRCGTTLLHELLILDARHTFPTTYQCLCPHHFLLTEGLARRLLGFLLPSKRPMDNMPMGWDRPQEDEFALANLGLPSPYLTIAFPNHGPAFPEYLDLREVSPADREHWKRVFVQLLREVTYRRPGRLVLKSPTHTCRVDTLLELFPDAKFVYLTRNPYTVFASTVHLWRSLYLAHGFQTPDYRGLEEQVLATFVHLHERFEATRHLIPPENLFALRYEDLVADPVGQLRRLYDQFDLRAFDQVEPKLRGYLQHSSGYRPNRYQPLPAGIERQITRRWSSYLAQHGYQRSHALA